MKAEPDEFGSEVMLFLKQDAEIKSFDSVNDIWRKNSYNNIYLSLKENDYKIVQLIQTSYKDTIEISKNETKRPGTASTPSFKRAQKSVRST